MPKKSHWNKVKQAATALILSGCASLGAAEATYNYSDWALSSDGGSYSPIALGDDIELDACGSRLYHKTNASMSYSVCDLPSVDYFRLYWYRYEPTLGYSLLGYFLNGGIGTFLPASEGLRPIFSTGAGTYFPFESDNYRIGIYLVAEANALIDLPDGNQAYLPHTISAFDLSDTFKIGPASVPEPLAALLLVPGFALIARRQKKRAQKAQV